MEKSLIDYLKEIPDFRESSGCKHLLWLVLLSQRIVKVFEPPADIDPKWSGVVCVISVERIGTRAGVPYQRIGYYLSPLKPTSEGIALGILQHWHIENRLHWVKDVIMNEDKSPQKASFAPINLSISRLGF